MVSSREGQNKINSPSVPKSIEPHCEIELMSVHEVTEQHMKAKKIAKGDICDIKPANVLLTWDNSTVKVCYMGLSRIKTFQTAMQSAHSGRCIGTPLYMATEVLLTGKATSTSTNIWSLGITIIEFLTMTEAWTSENNDLCDMEKLKNYMEARQLPCMLAKVHPLSYREAIVLFINYESSCRQPISKVLATFEKLIGNLEDIAK